MKFISGRILIASVAIPLGSLSMAQSLYFPPNLGVWDTVSPVSLGWCVDSIAPLYEMLDSTNTKAFLVLKDGRIVIEKYFDTFTQDSAWYWASAGKSMTAFLVGMAQQEGFLTIADTSSEHMGPGWTSCPPNKEEMITIRHQLTMTTGLDDSGLQSDCTDPACLQYLADAGTRWAYHNAPYTRLDSVIESSTGQNLNTYLFNKLTLSTGFFGTYLPIGYNNVLFSTPRTMARFGLLMLADGTWNGTPVMSDQVYLNAMITPSQQLNQSYGYLWWLNGRPTHMLPGLQLVISGSIVPQAPSDMYAAIGKNGQLLNVVPSQGLIVVRMGEHPGSTIPVPNFYNDDIWALLNGVMCSPTAIDEPVLNGAGEILLHPVPASDRVFYSIEFQTKIVSASAVAVDGKRFDLAVNDRSLDISALHPGTYVIETRTNEGRVMRKRLVVAR